VVPAHQHVVQAAVAGILPAGGNIAHAVGAGRQGQAGIRPGVGLKKMLADAAAKQQRGEHPSQQEKRAYWKRCQEQRRGGVSGFQRLVAAKRLRSYSICCRHRLLKWIIFFLVLRPGQPKATTFSWLSMGGCRFIK
jgi:hypothetical protein